MIRGLINAEPHLPLADGGRIRIDEARPPAVGEPDWSLKIVRESDTREILWARWVEGMAGDPTSGHNRSDQNDYRGLFWEPAGLVVLAGASRVLGLDWVTGDVVISEPLVLTASSLDLLEIVESSDGEWLMAISTRRVVGLDGEPACRWSWEPEGLLAAPIRVLATSVSLTELDTGDPALRSVAREIRFASGVFSTGGETPNH